MGTSPLLKASVAVLACLTLPGLLDAQTPIRLERRVHVASTASELNPSIGLDQNGRSVIAWEATGPSTVLFRAFDERGDPLSDQAVIHSPTPSFRSWPSISMERRGSARISWDSFDETGFPPAGPFARCLDAESRPSCDIFQAAQEELSLNGVSSSVDLTAEGVSAFAWYVFGTEETPAKLAGAVYSPTSGPAGQTFVVDEAFVSETDARRVPRVAVLGSDRLVVVWAEEGADSDGHGVVGRYFSTAGAPLGPAFRVSSFEPGEQLAPDVSSSPDGSFVVVWESWRQDGCDQGVYGQRFAPDGLKIGSEFQISSSAPTGQHAVSVDMDAGGRFVVSWSSHQESADRYKDIFARAFRADGSPIGEQIWVTQGGAPPDEQENSDVALSDSGILAVAYESYRCDAETGDCSKDVMTSWFSLPCERDGETICLQEDRFRVRAFWKDYEGRSGLGQSYPITADTGGFWFFGEDNFEVMAKVIDGCDYNQQFWFYAAGLTDVEVDLVVEDSWSGSVAVFTNSLGSAFVPVQKIDQFPTCDLRSPSRRSESRIPSAEHSAGGLPNCSPDGGSVCLQEGRFEVRVEWEDFSGNSGSAHGFAVGADTALFSFFGPDNIEIAAKVIDGCASNDRFWVYLAGLTNVGVTTRIVDSETQETWVRTNILGAPLQPSFDVEAFASCGLRP